MQFLLQSGASSQEATRRRYTLRKPPGKSRYEIAEGEQLNVRPQIFFRQA